jgi:DMSO/TMAO reductase YedYZ molybdopterin-dependent catalytic subunit
MPASNPFASHERRPHTDGPFDAAEVRLANRNSGILLETLRHDVTPAGLHYLLNHFDVPYVPDADWRVAIGGRVEAPLALSLGEIKAMPARTLRVTLECAGNGRAAMSPRYQSMPWSHEAVGTAEWTGTPLRNLLERSGLLDDAIEISFLGADRGFDRATEHDYGRSLQRDVALGEDVLVAWAMNGAPLLPQHGFPLRLIVPGWYGMASVKWLNRIEALGTVPGFPAGGDLHLSGCAGWIRNPGHTHPGQVAADPAGHSRLLYAQPARRTRAYRHLRRAWSGAGVLARVELGVDGVWQEAELNRM